MRRLVTVLLLAAAAGLPLVPAASARNGLPIAVPAGSDTPPAESADVVLPSRVANAVARAQKLLDVVGMGIDTVDAAGAAKALKALEPAVVRIDKAARRQMSAVPASEGATPGPDSVVATLAFEQATVTTLAGYFDGQSGSILGALTHALFATMNVRDKLVRTVAAQPADYGDALADELAGYDDEVANIAEAIADDRLSTGGKKVLRAALAQSKATRARINAAFGGGE
jgi:hypothetical protein